MALSFRSLEIASDDDYSGIFTLKAAIATDGWTPLHIRRFAGLSRPHLKAERPYWRWHLDGKLPKKLLRIALVILDVRYPQKYEPIVVPDEQLARVLPLLRQNLEFAVDLEHEISSRHSAEHRAGRTGPLACRRLI